MSYITNTSLKIIKPNWNGNLVDEQNRFVNLEYPFLPDFADVAKWMFSRNPQRQEKKRDTFRLSHINDPSFFENDKDCIVWLGHASFFIRLNKLSMLIDPVFFNVPFVKRYADHAYTAGQFKNIDYLLISHDHQDHCQEKSIRVLASNNPRMKILTGLNMQNLLKPWTKNLPIQTAGWYQQYETDSAITICYLPSRHWSKRGLNDDNKRLWGAFIIQSESKTIYFSGDTGYGNHFHDARILFPNIDIAIIGIGAYKPEWFMHPNHVSPYDAVKAFHDLNAKIFIPMHYGTFDVSDEPVGEPLRVIQQMDRENKINGKLKVLQLGESLNNEIDQGITNID